MQAEVLRHALHLLEFEELPAERERAETLQRAG
jgi:hypothetical protein